MKINFKSKRVIGGLITIILLGFGIADPGLIVPVATEAVCAEVKCDA